MTAMAKRVPHLVQKGHSYYFRIRVPATLGGLLRAQGNHPGSRPHQPPPGSHHGP